MNTFQSRTESSKSSVEVQSLNESFLHSCQAAVDDNKQALLVPLIKDYLIYAKDVLNQGKGEAVDNSFSSLGTYFQKLEASVGPVGKNNGAQNSAIPQTQSVKKSESISAGFFSSQATKPSEFASTVIKPFANDSGFFSRPNVSNGSSGINIPASQSITSKLDTKPSSASTTILFPTTSFNFMNPAMNKEISGSGSISTGTVLSNTTAPTAPVMNSSNNGGGDTNEEEDDKPPENKFVPVEESDSIHTVK